MRATTSDACSGRCVNGGSKALGKFSLSLLLVQAGFDVVYVDFDTYLFENPLPMLRREAAQKGDVELLVGGSVFDDCINNGFYYLRQNGVRRGGAARRWLSKLFVYLYHHPYLVDQKVMSAFLGNHTQSGRV